MPADQKIKWSAKDLAALAPEDPKYGSVLFGSLLKTLIRSRKLKNKELAAKVGMTEPGISHVITGKSRPYDRNYEHIKNALELSVDEELLLDQYRYNPQLWQYRRPESLWKEPKHQPDTKDRREATKYTKALVDMQKRAEDARFSSTFGEMLEREQFEYAQNYVVGEVFLDYLLSFKFLEYVSPTAHDPIEGYYEIERQIGIVCDPDPTKHRSDYRFSRDVALSRLPIDEVIVVVPFTGDPSYGELKEPSVLHQEAALKYLNGYKLEAEKYRKSTSI